MPLARLLNLHKEDYTTIFSDLVRQRIVGRMEVYSDRIQKSLSLALDELIGDCKEPKLISNPLDLSREIIARSVATIYVGEELCHDKEIIRTFKNFAGDVTKRVRTPPFLSFIHPWLSKKLFIMQFKFGDNAVRNHRSLLISRIKPTIEKRLKDQINFGESYQKPNDLIQDLIDHAQKDQQKVDCDRMVSYILILVWTAIHTTSHNFFNALQEYATRPEYWDELLEEQQQVIAGNNSDKFELLAKMRRLDSFIKESMRTYGNTVGLTHQTMTSEFTFSNGYQVPEGRGVGIYVESIYHNKVLQGADATEFNGRRYLEKNSSASQIGRDFLVFGLGRHACPGRFLAVNEIKFLLSEIILRYKITPINSPRKKKIIKAGFVIPNNAEELIFEK
ncbi:830_t:CDS:2, partial [Ambispora gerdemannii]